MKNHDPLDTETIVKYIKASYKKTSERVFENCPLLFGVTNEIPTILISFSKKVPNDENFYSSETRQCYLVKNFNQVIEILEKLEIYRESSGFDLKKEYTSIALDENKKVYLSVTNFKPLNIN